MPWLQVLYGAGADLADLEYDAQEEVRPFPACLGAL